jgi:hypothetical protein
MIEMILCFGIGFSPGGTMYIPTLGFNTGFIPVGATTGSRFLLLGVG